MRAISIFSIAFLTLSVWSLFFAVSHIKTESQLEAEVSYEVNQDIVQEVQEVEKVSTDILENSDDQDELESNETEVVKQSTKKTEPTVVVEEEKPTTLVAQASSRFNDILYDFERNNPISVDDLLQVLMLQE